ncbi:hypothetical protein D9757_008321 [Collybiopsis confluens]|uniref:DUF6830 domain-containing protein n=1 Tax=Collybiopsis confluens TaxID=2823264 RepID=A0A8H5M5V8_9AGAR|nr:hypothetical protein D9757_008321 [Collybiopsis confluens]
MPSEFLCPVPMCHKHFSKPGDRERHIKAKQDDAHRMQYQRQLKAQSARISSTINQLDNIAHSKTSKAGTAHEAASKMPSISHTGKGHVLPQSQPSHFNDSGPSHMMDVDNTSSNNRSQTAPDPMEVDTIEDGYTSSSNNSDCDDNSNDGDLDDDCSEDGSVTDNCESLCSLSLSHDSNDRMEDIMFQTEPHNHEDINLQQLQKSYHRDAMKKYHNAINTSMQFDFLPPHESAGPYIPESNKSDSDDVNFYHHDDSDSDSSSSSMNISSTTTRSNSSDSIEDATSNAVRNMAGALVKNEEDEPRTWWWHPTAGKVIGKDDSVYHKWKNIFLEQSENQTSVKEYFPFASQLDWEVAEWAVKEKISQKSFDRFLQIPQVKERLGLSYVNSRAMLEYIDAIPNKGGAWFTKELSFRDQPDDHFIMHHRDPVQAIKALWGDPAFAKHLVYKPGKLFYGSKQTESYRMFSEMWTGGFWNAVQDTIPSGGTVCPVIIASDKTNLTRFSGNKSMAHILEPLKSAGDPNTGGIKMTGGDGAVRRVYPILCSYVADYPEQCLVACTKYGTCPKCKKKADELQLPHIDEFRTQSWTMEKINEAQNLFNHIDKRSQAKAKAHTYAMKLYNIAGGFKPFWAEFPLTDIHKCITPDILHQCYQGIFKYLMAWIQEIVGVDELDERLQTLPPTHGIRHFKKGIADFSQITGSEHKHIAHVFLPSLVGKVDSKGIRACRSLLNFIYLAQYSLHDQETLGYMDAELKIWHKNKNYFIKKGVRSHFNIPKFHSLHHYIDSIRWLGTTDNYNTEAFERYHIDMAKKGWEASNKRDHFPQMTQWLARQEKIMSYDFYRNWVDLTEEPVTQDASDLDILDSSVSEIEADILLNNQGDEGYLEKLNAVKASKPIFNQNPAHGQHSNVGKTAEIAKIQIQSSKSPHDQLYIQIAKHPHEPKKSLGQIHESHNAPGFISTLKLYLSTYLLKGQQAKKTEILQTSLPFTSVNVWHQFKFTPPSLLYDDSDLSRETVKAIPSTKRTSATRYDTVIVKVDHDKADCATVKGCRVGRVKVIFQLPQSVMRLGIEEPSPAHWPTTQVLAYVTWFSPFKSQADTSIGMYVVKPSIASNGIPQGDIIPLSDIRQTCMLTPSSPSWDSAWTSENVLDRGKSFFVNNLQSKYTYQTIY